MTDAGLPAAGVPTAADRPLGRVVRPLLWCRADEPIREVAVRVGEAGQSFVVMDTGSGLGIVTDHDFRARVATGTVDITSPVGDLASVPVQMVDERASAADVVLRMVEHGVHHLVVTGPDRKPVGVVRAVDLAQFEVRAPLALRSAIHAAMSLDALAAASLRVSSTVAELRMNGLPAIQCGAMQATLVDAILRRALSIRPRPVLAEFEPSWLVLGSTARREPLPGSDLDTALLWVDPPPSTPDPGMAIRAAATEVLADLRQCGLRPCPHGVNADNPLFSRSRSAWTVAAQQWLDDPSADGALLLSAMVTDSRPVTEPGLGEQLARLLTLHPRTIQFLRALLDEAMRWRPSTGVLRDFLVARRGAHRGQLDLKRGALVPMVALGRWIAIVSSEARGTTPERLARGADTGLITPDERDTLLGGFERVYTILFDLEARSVLAGTAPGTFLRPPDLDSLTRRILRETLRAVHSVQSRVDESWIRRIER